MKTKHCPKGLASIFVVMGFGIGMSGCVTPTTGIGGDVQIVFDKLPSCRVHECKRQPKDIDVTVTADGATPKEARVCPGDNIIWTGKGSGVVDQPFLVYFEKKASSKRPCSVCTTRSVEQGTGSEKAHRVTHTIKSTIDEKGTDRCFQYEIAILSKGKIIDPRVIVGH